ncbi:hypothetical protein PC39_16021 [Salinisphaera sp. PC39]|uniref:hypothetical protein n=1 Tax=Salinisphaera sp. PC39 TaxID=1304156 RepID=UPI00333EB057
MKARGIRRFPRTPTLTALAIALGGFALNAGAGDGTAARGGDALYSQPGAVSPDADRLARELGDDGVYRFQARFRDFEGRPLAIRFDMPAAWSRQATAEFGVSDVERKARYNRCQADPDCTWSREWRRYYHDHGMRLLEQDNGRLKMVVDVPAAVARNRDRVRPVVRALRELAARNGRDTQWAMQAAMALVQGGMRYERPAQVENGRKILDFYPPPRALEQGYGDCDTKSALLAAILQHLTDRRIVGVHVPDHYLLGIAGEPAPGQRWIEHEGETYILVEASGPAIRPPGDVSDQTLAALEQGAGLRVDPMY